MPTFVIVGGGLAGAKAAEALRDKGFDGEIVLFAAEDHLPYERPPLSKDYLAGKKGLADFTVHPEDWYREHDVDLLLGASVESITTEGGKATGLALGDGSTVRADTVLVAVGATPNTDLAAKAGVAMVDGGVAVDPSLKTSDDDVYAVAGMLGDPGSYDELPYFYTDQYDLGMEYVGHAPHYDSVVFRGDTAKREFTVFWLDAEKRVLAGMKVNVWEGLDDIKAVVRSRKPVDAAKLADPKVALGDLVA